MFCISGTQNASPWLGSNSVDQALKGAPWVGSYSTSVHQAFDVPDSLVFSCQCWHVGREAMVMAPPPMHDSAVLPYFHGCLAFLHRHFPPQSPPLHPLDLSLCGHQQSAPWDCPTISKLQLLAAVSSRGPVFLSSLYGCNKDSLILITFQFSSVQSLVMSDSLQPHELQHTRTPCPSPTPRVYPNPCPLSR